MRTRTLILPVLLVSAVAAFAAPPSAEVRDPLGPFGSIREKLKLRSEYGGWSLEYCPDNTCERFTCNSSSCQGTLIDFGFLYLAHVSGYADLAEFRRKDVPGPTPSVLAKHKTACPQSAYRDAAVCILRELHKKDRVRVSFVRHDEGERNEGSVDLEQEIQRSTKP